MDLFLFLIVLIAEYYVIRAILGYHQRLAAGYGKLDEKRVTDSSERTMITSFYYSSYKYLA
ncbi:MAG: hypothetical protein ACOYWZ_13450 [Bacillota bacterium]